MWWNYFSELEQRNPWRLWPIWQMAKSPLPKNLFLWKADKSKIESWQFYLCFRLHRWNRKVKLGFNSLKMCSVFHMYEKEFIWEDNSNDWLVSSLTFVSIHVMSSHEICTVFLALYQTHWLTPLTFYLRPEGSLEKKSQKVGWEFLFPKCVFQNWE